MSNGNGNGNGNDTLIPDVSVTTPAMPLKTIPSLPLATPPAENGASKVLSAVTNAIDEATTEIVLELEKLSQEIEAIKTQVIQNGGAAKASMTQHFNLGAEACAFAGNIRERLNHLIDKAEDVAKGTTN